MFISQLAIGTCLVILTVLIHALALDSMMTALERLGPKLYKHTKKLWKALMLIVTVTGVFLAHIVQIWVWALFFFKVDALAHFQDALYFSTASFTTVGYGDIVLGKEWRLLGSFESANGLILFGWSTAFIFEVMSKLYKDDSIGKTEKKKK